MKMLILFAISLKAFAVPTNHNAGIVPYFERKENKCSTIDAREANPALKEHWEMPRDQDGIGWCYAYAASDILTAATGVPVSALDLSYSYNRRMQDNLLTKLSYDIFSTSKEGAYEGGFIGWVLNQSKEGNGICPENVMPSQTPDLYDNYEHVTGTLKALNSLREKVKARNLDRKSFVDCWDCQVSVQGFWFQNLFPSLSMEVVYDSIMETQEKSLNDLLYNMADKACAGARIKVDPKLKFHQMFKANNGAHNTFPTIDRILAKGGVVGISGSSRMYNKDYDGGHATTIVARSFRDGKCKYFVRNSWGRGCYGYMHPTFNDNDCDAKAGGVWMTEDHIRKHVSTINYAELD